MQQIKVLLVVEHTFLQSVLRLWLERNLAMQVVGEVTELEALLATVEETLPDILLLDWEISRAKVQGGIRPLLHTLRIQFPRLRVIALSMHPESKQFALDADVDAFVMKVDLPKYLLGAFTEFAKR